MGFTEIGYAKQTAEGIAGHDYPDKKGLKTMILPVQQVC
ncbi:hypothetical protein LT85_1664 [Collimonas arenae]|uniref:Uncharacterized protein n=1 Tax=Collimonas arenae TaxID=279058 RepID=A0A0A1FDA9_9BURK|nr:hypothetical protein LT85_1664 [Collimonas arenae]